MSSVVIDGKIQFDRSMWVENRRYGIVTVISSRSGSRSLQKVVDPNIGAEGIEEEYQWLEGKLLLAATIAGEVRGEEDN